MLFLAGGQHPGRLPDQVAPTRSAACCRPLPVTGALWLAGFLAITGSPPFGLFLSELTILKGGVARRACLVAAVVPAGAGRRLRRHGRASSCTWPTASAARAPSPDAARVAARPGPCCRPWPLGPVGAGPGPLRAAAAPDRRCRDAAAACGSPTDGADRSLASTTARRFALADCPRADPRRRSGGGDRAGRRPGAASPPCWRPRWPDAVHAPDSPCWPTRPDEPGRCSRADGRRRSYPRLTPDCPQAHWFEREIAEQWGIQPAGPPVAQADPASSLGRRRPGAGHRRHRLLPHGGRGGPRGGRRARCTPASSSRGISASSATARRSTTWRSRWATSTAASSGRCSAARTGAPSTTSRPLAGDTTDRPRHRLLPGRGGAGRTPRCRRGPGASAASPRNWSGWPTTSATSAPWPATSASCRRMSYCGRIRGDVLNMTALLCGNRFGRGLVRPGGVTLRRRRPRWPSNCCTAGWTRSRRTPAAPWSCCSGPPSVLARFEGTGTVSAATAATDRPGRPGRAGLRPRARRPAGLPLRHLPLRPHPGLHLGQRATCFARAYVRWLEVQRSLAFIREQLGAAARRAPIARDRPAAAAGPAGRVRWSRAGAARSATSP